MKPSNATETASLDGEERWSATVGKGPIRSMTVVEEGADADHNSLVSADATRFAPFAPDGERTWERSIDESIEVSRRRKRVRHD